MKHHQTKITGRIDIRRLDTALSKLQLKTTKQVFVMIAYILAKNEENNIGRCVGSLLDSGVKPIVLDSGSTDQTLDIVAQYNVEVCVFNYKNHCEAYNEITTEILEEDWCLILDADMMVSRALIKEVKELVQQYDVVIVPVQMYYEGQPLSYASLYPPKPIAFRRGKKYFEPIGHGEKLIKGVKYAMAREKIIHDDRKSLIHFFDNQVRYADALIRRGKEGNISKKDWIRLNTPLGIILVPLIILFLKMGLLDGKPGIIYTLDRMIAEILKYRRSLVADIEETKETQESF